MTMPGDITFDSGNSYFGGNLTAFVQNGTISLERVDDMGASHYLPSLSRMPFPILFWFLCIAY